MEKRKGEGFRLAVQLTHAVCVEAGSVALLDEARAGLLEGGVIDAVSRHDDGPLFDWLMEPVSYRGIADAIALSYMERHGRIGAHEVEDGLRAQPPCPKLGSYWSYSNCGYHKGSRTCAEPEHIDSCPLPHHDLRNGGLNQTAYSLFLFFRDVAEGDFVGWIDRQLSAADRGFYGKHRTSRLRRALLEPLGHVYGVSNKVLSMALSDLLLAADANRPLWVETGVSMIAVDTLVHNWLHRTGLLRRFDCEHPYGPGCYSPRGCAYLIAELAEGIDAREFNPSFSKVFPRFVQHAIWRFCAQNGLDQCNGNRIDDRAACERAECALFAMCERQPLRSVYST